MEFGLAGAQVGDLGAEGFQALAAGGLGQGAGFEGVEVALLFTRITEWGYPDVPARLLLFDADRPIIDKPLPRFLDDAARAPVTAARAEAAWLNGRGTDVDGITRDVLTAAVDRRASWVVGELAWLRRLAGIHETVPWVVEPYASQLAGAASAAAARWTELGCPYDAALALVQSDDEPSLRHALAEFQRLGARPAAGIVARRLRDHGVRDLPRGPRAETVQNPAGLTHREAEVLAHVQQGASNAEIAARLYLSEKTVQHHVSAILRKLGVSSRGQAVFEAARRGLITPADGGAEDAHMSEQRSGPARVVQRTRRMPAVNVPPA